MDENESELAITEQLADVRASSAPASIAQRAWAELTDWDTEDFLVGLLIVPVAVAAGGILALTLLLVGTLFAPVLAAWLLWLAFRPKRRPVSTRGATA
jgi:hypothetical protein